MTEKKLITFKEYINSLRLEKKHRRNSSGWTLGDVLDEIVEDAAKEELKTT